MTADETFSHLDSCHLAGMDFHAYGVSRNMGGWRNWSQRHGAAVGSLDGFGGALHAELRQPLAHLLERLRVAGDDSNTIAGLRESACYRAADPGRPAGSAPQGLGRARVRVLPDGVRGRFRDGCSGMTPTVAHVGGHGCHLHVIQLSPVRGHLRCGWLLTRGHACRSM